jgi:hypothetical protein
MRIRATFGSVAPPPLLILTLQFPIPLPPLTIYLDRWYLRRHFCDISRPTVDFQVAAQQRHPLTHAGETQTLAGPTPVGALLRVEARPPIPHVQAHSAVQAPECDLSSFRPVPPATLTAADCLKNLPTIVVYGAQEYPPLEAEKAVALCLFGVSVVSFAGCRVESVAGERYPYLVHSGHPFFCGPGLGVRHHLRGPFHNYSRIVSHTL